MKKREKLVNQLFIGKVSEIIGFDETTDLLKEARNAFLKCKRPKKKSKAMENLKKSNELLEAIVNGVAFDKETGLIWEHWLKSITEQVEKNNLELCDGECSHENSGLHKHFVNGSAWSDSSVIDFVNWFLSVHKLDFRYTLENQTLIDSFKNGDKPEIWHCR